MTSILTNTAAMAALQTLRSVGIQLSQTQDQISSGLRVQAAADNAAYWSISTTMRSDNMVISAVADALGLGAAKIDVSYAGLDTTVDILSEFQAKLVAAKEPGVDKTKVQKELDQLKQQLLSTASSASFNGVNWLKTDAPQNLWELSSLPTSLTSSFIRSADGLVQVGTTEVNLADVSLFNAGGGGALQRDIRSLGDIGGFRSALLSDAGLPGTQTRQLTGLPITLTSGDTITLDINVDGAISRTLVIDKSLIDSVLGVSTGSIGSAADYRAVVAQALVAAGIDNNVTVSTVGSNLQFRSQETSGSTEASVTVGSVARSPNGATGFISSTTQTWQTTGLPVTLATGEAISLHIDVDGVISQTLTIDEALINSTLGISTGTITSAADYAAVLTQAFSAAGINSNVAVSTIGSSLQFQTSGVSSGASVGVSGITRSPAGATGLASAATTTAGVAGASIGDYAKTQFAFTSPFRIYREVAFQFELKVNNTVKQVSIDRNLVDATLGTTDGFINTATQMAQVLDAALAIHGVKVSANAGNVVLDIDPNMYPQKGTRSIIAIDKVKDNIGPIADFDITDVDITDPASSLDNYMSGLDVMLQKVTSAASTLGSAKTRIDMQTNFSQTLMDTLDKGIGRLVDADMNEASTRLKALQAQQQLAIQALQIANSDAGNIMMLFK
ncbi:flagellin [Sinorhizobium chiapasense]